MKEKGREGAQWKRVISPEDLTLAAILRISVEVNSMLGRLYVAVNLHQERDRKRILQRQYEGQ